MLGAKDYMLEQLPAQILMPSQFEQDTVLSLFQT